MTDKPRTGRPPGARDIRKRSRNQPEPPINAFPATAQDAGRTVHVRINGMISPEAHEVLQNAPGSSLPERLDAALKRLAKQSQP